MMHTGRHGDSPMTRSCMEAVARLEDEGGGGDLGTHGRREGEHHVERDATNQTAVIARAE